MERKDRWEEHTLCQAAHQGNTNTISGIPAEHKGTHMSTLLQILLNANCMQSVTTQVDKYTHAQWVEIKTLNRNTEDNKATNKQRPNTSKIWIMWN